MAGSPTRPQHASGFRAALQPAAPQPATAETLTDEDDYARDRAERLSAAAAALGPEPIAKYVAAEPSEPESSATARAAWPSYLPTWSDLALALRNLTRHRRRTGMGLLAISAGVVAMLFAGGFIEWSKWFLRETTIMAHLGHIQLVKKDFFVSGEADPFAFVMAEDAALLAAIERRPEVETVTPRLGFSGLIAFDDVSIAVLGEGVDPTLGPGIEAAHHRERRRPLALQGRWHHHR